jgi:stearoyl-CoA desaturase (delta-9 desaturase)
MRTAEPRAKDWTNILFLSLSPLVGVIGTALYAWRYGIAWWEPLLFFTLFMGVGIGIGSGYHRHFSHRTYECHPVVEAFLLFFGALALQNSCLQWSRDHRDHHRFVDKDWDPYNINRGGWYAHILWIFYKEPKDATYKNVPDLTKNKLVMLQHRFSGLLGIGVGLGLPLAIGALFGRPIGGLLWGGFLRIVLVHHTTFFVNSLAHLYGTRPYTEENSARDNWLLAFFTHGEGYHNFHHRFPADYRNGIRWFHWDPNKWFIGALGAVGLAHDLQATPPAIIEKARLQVAALHAGLRLSSAKEELGMAVRARLEAARQSLEEAQRLWQEAQERRRLAWDQKKREAKALLASARQAARECEERIRVARAEWQAALEMLTAEPIQQPA